MSTAFSDVLRTASFDETGMSITVADDWTQGRSIFGGMQAAIGALAMRRHVDAALPLRSLQTTFIAPVPTGAVRVHSRLLRQGKSVVHAEARIVSGDDTLAIFIGIYGAARVTQVRRLPVQPSVECAKPRKMPFVSGVSPLFTRAFPASWLRGPMPYVSSQETSVVVELDMVDAGPTTESHVIALADYIPPVALSALSKPAPGSSLNWLLEFLTEDFAALPLTGWRVDAEMQAARDGYTHQSVMLWGPGGIPVALSRQTMAVFG